ncbi:folylpolyglutamate synthase/dihydrofolate synthase family protein [Qipengyuania sp. G39]|uniref:Folylpolyglutamate synthase/dihydrofolate synthase family protein n=1 Tax=Qipengyuania profundimaris TaxID=3067652 RepID=A0ABT9HQV4_9SPHN|nr:folylpolyglutamate synthase/dihydrofolate synthase family protein [Qipengyuania sp. G39]MDP4575520.1 folylpolyglutamate synthase/dihydrofolate synthase family protein [Qipengyuania sp. G39]
MRDFARSDSPDVQRQLDRLGALSVPQGRLGLDTIRSLLARLGDPHKRLPPTFHVAGTNGKGSTCAFLRAMLEAEGYRVHVTTSPHLVRYNERIRLAGELISDERLAAVLEEVLDASADLAPSFFEVTIAAAFTEFARVPADACVVEVGLGGRFDATNVLEPDVLAACGITALGIDHERFLLAPDTGVPEDPIARIAFEKAGIAKRGVPLVTLCETYPEIARYAIAAVAVKNGAISREIDPSVVERLSRKDLGLPGAHQHWNAALAVAMLASQDRLTVSDAAIERGLARTEWPARLHRLSKGALVGNREVWLDGGHNRSAGEMLAEHFRGQRIHLILGMLEAKDPQALIDPLAGSIASLTAVPVPGHDHHGPDAFGQADRAATDLPEAMAALPMDALPVLIAGSLYLAGEVLRLNGELPD